MGKYEFVTFQKFSSLEEAEELINSLKQVSIPVQLEDATPTFDLTFSGSKLNNEIRLKIRQADFEKANQLLEQKASDNISQYSEDHYLFDFSVSELMEVVEKSDEWSKEDYLLALQILKSKGNEFSEAELNDIKNRRLLEIRKTIKAHRGWLVFGYSTAFLGGFLALFIGWYYWKFKKTDPNGQQYFVYDEKSRGRGKRIFQLASFFVFFWLVLALIIYT